MKSRILWFLISLGDFILTNGYNEHNVETIPSEPNLHHADNQNDNFAKDRLVIREFVSEFEKQQKLIEALYENKVLSFNLHKDDKEKEKNHLPSKLYNEYFELKNRMEFIQQNDPVMAQLIEGLIDTEIGAKRALTKGFADSSSVDLFMSLKQLVFHTLMILAKRQKISLEKIETFEKMDKEQLLQEMARIWYQDYESKGNEKNGSSEKGEKCHSDNNSREKRMMELVMTAFDDGDEMPNISSIGGHGRRRRRRKRTILDAKIILVIVAFITFVINLACCMSLVCHRTQNVQIPQTAIQKRIDAKMGKKYVKVFKELNSMNIAQPSHSTAQKPQCGVCLMDFEPEERVRPLPSCQHIFHDDCIILWFERGENSCPLCRAEVFNEVGLFHKVRPSQPSVAGAFEPGVVPEQQHQISHQIDQDQSKSIDNGADEHKIDID